MALLDATCLAERLQAEANEYWLHVEAESPLDKYPAKQHARRVQEKLGVEHGLIYLLGQELEMLEDSDMPKPFHQRRYFYYMSGCNEPDCHVAYDVKHDILTLFIPKTEERRAVYYGPGLTLAQALVKYDVDEVYYADELEDFIAEWSRNSPRGDLYALHHSQVPGLPRHFLEQRRNVNLRSLQPAMNIARMIKDDHEIQLIRKANAISSEAHRKVLANITKFHNEAQVEGLFRDVCVAHQAKNQAYDPIAASGPNAAILHYDANDEDFEDRQLMCLDASCEYELYASDITRTFPLSDSWPSKEAENIYKLVERMQESCIKRIAPGVRYLDLHILAHQIAIDGLLQLGLLHNGTKEEIYRAGTSKAFFLHGLGHHVGLEVHDVGQAELMSIRRGKPVFQQAPSLYPENFHIPVYDEKTCMAPVDPLSSHLEEGMVVTVEPGIYFSVYALQNIYLPDPIHSKYINAEVVKRYMSVGGVRIEDDILVTARGYENLTTAPKGDAMLKIIRSGHSMADRPWSRRYPLRRKNSEEEPPRFRAPGILSEEPASMLKPLSRAATMPNDFRQHDTVDFEPAQGPSLFSNFKQRMTTDEQIEYWHRQRQEKEEQEATKKIPHSNTICGEENRRYSHIYMTTETNDQAGQSRYRSDRADLPPCTKCTMLCEALNRLRQHFTSSTQNSPSSEARPTPVSVSRPEQAQTPRFAVALENEKKVGFVREVSPELRSHRPEVELPQPGPSQLRHRHSVATFESRDYLSSAQRPPEHSPSMINRGGKSHSTDQRSKGMEAHLGAGIDYFPPPQQAWPMALPIRTRSDVIPERPVQGQNPFRSHNPFIERQQRTRITPVPRRPSVYPGRRLRGVTPELESYQPDELRCRVQNRNELLKSREPGQPMQPF